MLMTLRAGLYTDESPGLKVDPFVVMVLSIGFIISVVALHSESIFPVQNLCERSTDVGDSHREVHEAFLFVKGKRIVALGRSTAFRGYRFIEHAPIFGGQVHNG